MTMDEILNILADNDSAMIVRPATIDDIALCNKDMTEMDYHPLPEGYIGFLVQLNGFAWNGIEFFSTDRVTDPETNYTLNDIVSANEDFVEYNVGLEHGVLLGRADDDLYIYNTQNRQYEILDLTGRDVMEAFATFESMFVGVVEPRI